jgi:type VI secretion system secreted protein Hcp
MDLMFLKLDGVRGESKAARHDGEIELTGFTWGQTSGGAGSGGGPGKAKLSDLVVVKAPDRTSAILREAWREARGFKQGVLIIEKVNERGSLIQSVMLKMQSVIIHFISYTDPRLLGPQDEVVELNFQDYKLVSS